MSYNENYYLLMNAVIKQAAVDYLNVKKKIHRNELALNETDSCKLLSRLKDLIENEWRYNAELDEVLNFFNGHWFTLYCSYDASYIIKKLDEEYNEWKHKYDKTHDRAD